MEWGLLTEQHGQHTSRIGKRMLIELESALRSLLVNPWSQSSRRFVACANRCHIVAGIFFLGTFLATVRGEDKPAKDAGAKEQAPAPADGLPVPLNKEGTVILDGKGKRVILKTHVALREGSLEMLCCLKQTKEHESILSLDAKAFVVHTGLLGLGAKPGTPVRFNPEYQPPTGQKIEIFLNWTDDKGKPHRVPAQSWIRQSINRFRIVKMAALPDKLALPKNSELRFDQKLKELSWYGPMSVKQKDEFLGLSDNKEFQKAIATFFEQSQPHEMKADWVFAGSGFFTDEDTGKKYYQAEDGDLICVANFPGATLDITMHSSAVDGDLNFEAYTERIPPKGTAVTIELIPVPRAAQEVSDQKPPFKTTRRIGCSSPPINR